MNTEDKKYAIIKKIAKAQDVIGVDRAIEIQNIFFGGGPLLEKPIYELQEMLDFMRFYYQMKGDRKK